MTKTISFVFPVYNDADSLDELLAQVKATVGQLKEYIFEFIFINDGSRDHSLEVMRSLAAKDKRVVVLSLSRNFGHQAAVTAGLDYARGDAVIIMDADLQDPPQVCLELVRQWENGYHVVYAQRRTRQDTILKRVTAKLYYRLLTHLSSVMIPRDTGDFRLVDRKVVDVVKDMREYHRFLRGMFSYVGFKQIAVPFDRQARRYGSSQYTFKKMIRLAKDGVFGFSDAPLKLVMRLGFLVSVLSTLGILYAFVLRVFFPEITVPGWTMIVVSIFFMGGVQLVMLGVIGEYIGRIYNEVRNRPTYIVAEEISSDKKT